MSVEVVSASSELEMIEGGIKIAAALGSGGIVALSGQLGAGKTHLSKGIVSGLGAGDEVTSPTFSLVQEYHSGRVPVFHFDFYRLESVNELDALGWDEYLEEEGVVIVEWADKFPEVFPNETKWFDLTIAENGDHLVTQR
tara:strand:+ start:843 stop:1262 length:420 start_codon:yes stop_codon:yes gene_type:complete